MRVYYVEYNSGWIIKSIDLKNLKYIKYHLYNPDLNRVAIGREIDGKWYTTNIRIDEWFKSEEDAKKWIDRLDNNSYILQELKAEEKARMYHDD